MRGVRARRFLGGLARTAKRRLDSAFAERALAHIPSPRMLHLGCGSIRFDGWVNIDLERLPSVDVRWDLRRGVPGETGSARFVYCEHLLEHLDADDGVRFLKDCRRVLQPGGVLRIAMPSLDYLLEKASSPAWRDQEWLRRPEYLSVQTRAEMLNIAFRHWGHRWLYDREELHRRLREAGFTHVEDVERQQSTHAELRDRESRDDSRLVCEATR